MAKTWFTPAKIYSSRICSFTKLSRIAAVLAYDLFTFLLIRKIKAVQDNACSFSTEDFDRLYIFKCDIFFTSVRKKYLYGRT